MQSSIDWPPELPRTPPVEREYTSKFEAGIRQTRKEIDAEMERVGADDWRLSESRSGDEPGVVLHWTKDGNQYAVGMDHYTEKRANLRALYLYIREKRKMEGRPVATGQSEFATARLPPGDDEAVVADDPLGGRSPQEVLGVPEALEAGQLDEHDREYVEEKVRQLKARYHPDGEDPDEEEWRAVREAEAVMLDE